MSQVNPPPFQIIPDALRRSPQEFTYHQNTQTVIRQLYEKIGGQTDPLADTVTSLESVSNDLNTLEDDYEAYKVSNDQSIQDNADLIQANTDSITTNTDDIAALTPRVTALEVQTTGITADYTTSTSENLFCTNTVAITITLNISPSDGEKLVIKRLGTGLVSFVGSVDGSAASDLVAVNDVIQIMAFDGAWYLL